MRYFRARAGDRGSHSVNRLITDQIADVGYDPRGTGFDELVVIELVEIVIDNRQLLLDQHEQRLQRPTRQRQKQVQLLLLLRGQRHAGALQRLQLAQLGHLCGAQPRQLRIFQAVDRGQPIEQFVSLRTHDITPRTTELGLGSSTRISAGCGTLRLFATGR